MEDQAISNARPAGLPHGVQTLIFGVLAAIAAAFALLPGLAGYFPWAVPPPLHELAVQSPIIMAGALATYQWYAIAAAFAFGIISLIFGQKAHKEYTANTDQYSAQNYADMKAGSHTAYATLVATVLISFFVIIS